MKVRILIDQVLGLGAIHVIRGGGGGIQISEFLHYEDLQSNGKGYEGVGGSNLLIKSIT